MGAAEQLKAGKLTALAVAAETRIEALPADRVPGGVIGTTLSDRAAVSSEGI
jgi:hypothetical protein